MKPHLQTTIWTLLEAGRQPARDRARHGDRSQDDPRVPAALRRGSGQIPPGWPPAPGGRQIPPPWPPAPAPAAPLGCAPTASACEPHRAFIEAQLRLRRNAMAIYQDLVDQHGFAGAYNSVKRFAGELRRPRARTVRPPGVRPRRGDAGRLRRGCAHARARHRPLPQAAAVRDDAALLAAQLPARGLEAPARRPGRGCTSRPGATSAAVAATSCSTTSRRASSSPTCTSPSSTPSTPRRWLTTAWWPTRRGSGPQSQGQRRERHRPYPGHGAEGPALRVDRGAERHSSSTGRPSGRPSRIHGSARRQVQAMFEEETRPSAALAAAGHAVLHRGAAHGLRRHLRARRSQQLRRTAGAHRQPGAGAPVRAPPRDPRSEDAGPAAHPRPRRAARHRGAAR